MSSASSSQGSSDGFDYLNDDRIDDDDFFRDDEVNMNLYGVSYIDGVSGSKKKSSKSLGGLASDIGNEEVEEASNEDGSASGDSSSDQSFGWGARLAEYRQEFGGPVISAEEIDDSAESHKILGVSQISANALSRTAKSEQAPVEDRFVRKNIEALLTGGIQLDVHEAEKLSRFQRDAKGRERLSLKANGLAASKYAHRGHPALKLYANSKESKRIA